ncbi:transcription factor bHLH68-like isoform X2 [Telopea speciosissima]|uniref:transcription factor bHLH68-like isoform X2 n=1 Tax=Telopea speciosissima TaxID=54955 RepID=UPI001CC75FAA|nr:transcription factor bHLH68-like isoform X2 [Telopea speciosissima]
MNRSVLQSSVVQQLMAGNPNWWNINNMRPPAQQPSPLLPSSSFFPQYPPPFSSLPLTSWHDNQELPESWSQLLLGGLVGEEDRVGLNLFQSKKLDNWEDQVMFPSQSVQAVDVKQEVSESDYVYGHGNGELQATRSSTWSQIMPTSSPRSCITSFSSNMLDFSNNNKGDGRHQQPDHSSECNSTATGGAFKKARVQPSSSQSTFKVRKEKLGDRITALHQLVSPFGKTDTASVLLEAIGYIRFLQGQIEALSSPYLGCRPGNMRQQQSVQGERNCIFPEDPGQLLNDPCMKGRGAPEQINGESEVKKDLRSRGLCLVPVSCTLHVGSDNGADYWAPTFGGGGFR